MDRGRRLHLHALGDRRREVDASKRRHALAELLAQMTRAYLVDLAFGQIAELERPERHPDQPVDRKPKMAKHVLDLAVLALAHREHEPHIGALLALELGLDRPIADAVEGDATAQLVEPCLLDAAMRAHPIAAQPAGRRQLQYARQAAVIGEEEQPLGAHVEAADAYQAREVFRQCRKDGRPALRIEARGHEPARLVIEKQPRALALRQRLAIDHDGVFRCHIEGRRGDGRAIDRDAAGRDEGLGLTARRKPGTRDHLGDSLARLLFAAALAGGHDRLIAEPAWSGYGAACWSLENSCPPPPSCLKPSSRPVPPARPARCRLAA